MKTRLNAAVLTLSVFASFAAGAQSLADRTRVESIAADWERAWSAHDMDALFDHFRASSDFANVAGHHWKGRQEIRAELLKRLPQFVHSTWKNKALDVQFIAPDVVLVFVDWALQGDTDPDGTPRQPREGVFTWVLVKQQGNWGVRSAQNTNLKTPFFVAR